MRRIEEERKWQPVCSLSVRPPQLLQWSHALFDIQQCMKGEEGV